MQPGAHAVTFAPPLLLWAVTVYKLPALSRSGHQPALSAYWSSIAWLAVAMTLLVPPLAHALDAAVAVPNLAWLLMYVAVLLAGFSATIALVHETPDAGNGRRVRRRRVLCACLVLILVVLFGVAHPGPETEDFVMTQGGRPIVAALLTTFYVGLAFICVDMFGRCRRAAAAVRGLLRFGLQGSALAAGLSLLYVAYNEAVVLLLLTGNGHNIPGDPLALSRALLLVIVSLIAVGTSAPDWGPRLRLDAAGQWVSEYRARRQLFTLWFDVRSAVPTVDVPSPDGRRRPLVPQRWSRWLGQRRAAALRDVLTFRDATFQLHRRVIDVTDGRLALTPFLDCAAVDALLRTVPGADADRAAVEAARLALSVTAKLSGVPAPGTRAASTEAEPSGLDGWSLQEEVDHQVRVAGYYRRFQPELRTRLATAAPSHSPAASSQT